MSVGCFSSCCVAFGDRWPTALLPGFKMNAFNCQFFSEFLIVDICWAPHILLPMLTLLQAISVGNTGPHTRLWLGTAMAKVCAFSFVFVFVVVAANYVVSRFAFAILMSFVSCSFDWISLSHSATTVVLSFAFAVVLVFVSFSFLFVVGVISFSFAFAFFFFGKLFPLVECHGKLQHGST